jgi:hypothetical protein
MTRMPVLNPLKRGMLIFLVSALLPVLLYALLDWLTNARFSFGDPEIGWCWDLACGGIVQMAVVAAPAAVLFPIILELRGWKGTWLGQLFTGFVIAWALIAIEFFSPLWIVYAAFDGLSDRIMLLQLVGLLAGAIVGYQYGRADRDILAKAGRDE